MAKDTILIPTHQGALVTTTPKGRKTILRAVVPKLGFWGRLVRM